MGLCLHIHLLSEAFPLISVVTHVTKVKHVLKCFAGLKPRFKYGSLKMSVKVNSFKQGSFRIFSDFHDCPFSRIFPYYYTDGCLDIICL